MPRAFDRHTLPITNDPNQGLEFHPQSVLKQAAGMWQTIVDLILEQAEAVVKELIQRILGLDIDPLQAIEDLWNQLSEWAAGIPILSDIIEAITGVEDGDLNDLGTFFLNIRSFLAGINFLDPDFDLGEAAAAFVNLIIKPLNIFSIPADVQADINGALGDLQDALDGSYSGSGPIFLAVQALAEAWLKATDPLNAANLFGRISLPQFGSGVPIMALTTAVPNELEPFSSTSVPNVDGWSFNAGQDAAQVVADGSTKTLYLQSGVIKVEAGQPLDTGVSVTYSGVSSSVGQSIRYVLETFTSDDGSGAATPVTVGSVSNPSGTITTPVLLGNSSWAIPAGVQSVRPVLVVDSLVTAGTVFWKNTPSLKKKLAGQLAGGLPNALDNAGQAIRDAIANALGHGGTGHTSANILTYLQNIPQTVVSGLGDLNTLTNQIRDILAGLVVTPINSTVQAIKDWFTGLTGKTANLTTGGLFDAGKLANITGTISQSLVTGLTSSLNALNTFIQNVVDAILSALRGVPIIGGVIADLVSDITGLKSTADTALDTSNQIVEDTNAGWTGGTPTGTPTAVYDTITEIRDAVNGVYTVEVKTTSGTWTNPGGITEFWAICIGSGDAGGRGGATASGIFSYGGGGRDASPSNRVGASGGKYIAQQINPADLTSTVSYTVPAGGTPAGSTGPVIGGAGAPAVFGAYVSSDINTNGSISSLLGFYDANSSGPGVGGLGGNVNTSDAAFKGTDGANTPLAVGGTGGALGGSSGSAGGNASLTGQTRCGGAGGGGGGGNATGTAGGGGAGGFPGGGGGGGGAARSGNTPGLGGNGANGAIVLIYR